MQSNSPHPTSPGPDRNHSKSRLTARQTAILVLFGLIGAAGLGVTAFLLFSSAPTGPAAAAVPLESPTPTAPAQQVSIAIPADCAKNGSNAQEGTARVIDGQTLEVTLDGKAVPVQFAGIKFSQEASGAAAFLESEIAGQSVLLIKDATGQDAHGNLVRYVFAGGRFINEDLVRQGFARADVYADDRACIIPFQLSEQQARIDRLGIWQATPVPTATFMPLVTLDPNNQSCDCSKKYTCSDFQTHAAAQTCFNACNDYSSKLDEDHNGVACENLP